MKRLFIGLFAAGVALGASAFTSLGSKRTVLNYYYVLTTSNMYQRSFDEPDPANCTGSAIYKCYVVYGTFQGLTFSANAMPSATPIAQSSLNGLYIP